MREVKELLGKVAGVETKSDGVLDVGRSVELRLLISSAHYHYSTCCVSWSVVKTNWVNKKENVWTKEYCQGW